MRRSTASIEDQYSSGAEEALQATGAAEHLSNWIPYVFVLDEDGQYAVHLPSFRQGPELGIDLETVFYFAESVLLPEFRGRGVGHAFFDAREAHARALGAQWCVFCAVVRDAAHPLRPVTCRQLDGFWRKRGYSPVEGARASFDWKDIDQPGETQHDLQVWMRAL